MSRPHALAVASMPLGALTPRPQRRLATLAVAVAVFIVLGAGATSPARAQTPLDPVVEEYLPSAAQFYAAESGAADLPCDVGCVGLVNDLRRAPTAPKDPVVPRILRSLVDKGKSAIRSPWKLPAATLSAAGALVAANVYVWKVHVLGAKPKDYYVKVPVETFHASDVRNWTLADGTEPLLYPTFYSLPSPLPVGVVATGSHSTILWQTGGTRCNGTPPSTVPPGVEEYQWHWNRCFEGYVNGVETYADLMAHGWKISTDTLFDAWTDAATGPDSPTTYPIDGVQLTQAEIEQRLRELLTSGDTDFDVVHRWIASVFGGEQKNPKDDYFTTPSCAGVAVDTCTSRLRQAGFTGSIAVTTLPTDDAVMEQAAGRVTATIPAANLEVAENHAFEVYVNPATLPKMTTAESTVANTLVANNPTTVNDSNKRTLARRCVRYAKAARRSTSDCTSLPILVQGSDLYGPARNAIAAIARNPSWFALNRRARPTSTGWYTDRAEPVPGCVRSQKKLASDQCDEFPFWSTLQAYGGTLNTAVPGIRWVAQPQNLLQGRVLSQFYSANLPGDTMRFKGCNIAPQSATDVAPTPASTFLNVPLPPGTPVVSVGICNKP